MGVLGRGPERGVEAAAEPSPGQCCSASERLARPRAASSGPHLHQKKETPPARRRPDRSTQNRKSWRSSGTSFPRGRPGSSLFARNLPRTPPKTGSQWTGKALTRASVCSTWNRGCLPGSSRTFACSTWNTPESLPRVSFAGIGTTPGFVPRGTPATGPRTTHSPATTTAWLVPSMSAGRGPRWGSRAAGHLVRAA